MQPSDPPDLTLRQLQTVVALAEYGSFIATAALMKTSQPAVTRTVKHLEDVLGIKLFDRSTRSVQITAAGKEFAAVAARMLNDMRITVGSMRDLADQRRGQIIVSSIMSVANGKLPGMVATYRLGYPGVELFIRDGVHGTVIEEVRSGAADFGITYLDELPAPFVSIPLGREEFTVVLSRNHPLAAKSSLALVDLRGQPLVSLPGDSRTRRLIDSTAASAKLDLNHVVVVSLFTTMLAFVRAGMGIAIAPKSGIAGLLGKELKAVPLRGKPLVRSLGIVALKERTPTVAAAELMEVIKRSWNRDQD
jgi:DNA-binding transcriptional LysR family regulator